MISAMLKTLRELPDLRDDVRRATAEVEGAARAHRRMAHVATAAEVVIVVFVLVVAAIEITKAWNGLAD